MVPDWLHVLSWISLDLGLLCALAIVAHEIKHPQRMWIMNLVWPLTGLYAPGLSLWAYLAIGAPMVRQHDHGGRGPEGPAQEGGPSWRQVLVSVTHCGAGCALGDIIGENLVFAAGWMLLGEMLYAEYLVTLIFAWLCGVGFQYFSIKPMKHLPVGEAVAKAMQADTLSIVFFQIGMYGWMAVAYFILFPRPHIHPDNPVFWFMMQVAMLVGSLAAYPINDWLLRKGVKEVMG
jgi:Domain of unknown function (DUF4396)